MPQDQALTLGFVITCGPSSTTLDLVLHGPDDSPSAVLATRRFEPRDSIFRLRVEMLDIWTSHHFLEHFARHLEHDAPPTPPLPPVRWIHRS